LKADGALVVSATTAQQLRQVAYPTEVPQPVGPSGAKATEVP
jgi:hypothetical protein